MHSPLMANRPMPAMTTVRAVALGAPVVLNVIERNAMLESSEWKAVTA